jgi:hypothetical protein
MACIGAVLFRPIATSCQRAWLSQDADQITLIEPCGRGGILEQILSDSSFSIRVKGAEQRMRRI